MAKNYKVTWSGHILSFLLTLIQEGQLSVTGESVCTNNSLINRLGDLSLPSKSVVKLTDHPDMIIVVIYCGCKTTTQQQLGCT